MTKVRFAWAAAFLIMVGLAGFLLLIEGGRLDHNQLVSAMRMAESKVEFSCVGPYRTIRDKITLYRRLLRNGRPVVASAAGFRPVTCLFSQELSETERESWLRECLVATKNRFYGGAIHKMITGPSSSLGRLGDRKDALVAIYNLSRDPLVKSEAFARWNELSLKRYNHDLEMYKHRTKIKPSNFEVIVGTGYRELPDMPVMPTWSCGE